MALINARNQFLTGKAKGVGKLRSPNPKIAFSLDGVKVVSLKVKAVVIATPLV